MIRFGVDFGGTKIEAAALDPAGQVIARARRATPPDYEAALEAVRAALADAESRVGVAAGRVGVCGPGSPSPATGLMRNANSVMLNGMPFPQDLERTLGRPVRYANDANCLALSEAADGAGAGAEVVFAVVLGTGCGGGLVVHGRLLEGRNHIAGEWGHTPLPGGSGEAPRLCWCGRRDCLELFLSGPGLARDAGRSAEAEIEAFRRNGVSAAFDRYLDRLGRGLAVVINLVDPDVIVLGGGLSRVDELYPALPARIAPHVFSDVVATPVLPARHGDSSGVRGAAWLWPEAET